MAFTVLQVLLLFICNSYYCLSQNTEELLFVSVREAIGEIKAVGQKVTEMENTMSSKFEEMENTMSSKFEGQLAELRGTSNVESVLQLCAETMEMELERIEHSISSKVSNLQELLATDECAAADSNDCSPNASCQDKMILYQCDCVSGYTGDGFTCCPTGFTHVPAVGCLKATEEKTNFDDAITHCFTLSAQLVVPKNFTALREYINSFPGAVDAYWVGIRNRQWLEGRDVGPGEWRSGEPNQDVSFCGYFFRNGIQDDNCTRPLRSVCQLK